ncbi:MAG: 3-deoxy-D-manno-octulosonic acid transferase [Elusimicrobiota bacterium]
MIYWYTFFYVLIFILALPWLVAGIIFNRRFRKSLHERLTLYPEFKKEELNNLKENLWIHAASVGEVKLIRSLPGFEEKENFLITCLTPEGRNEAQKIFKNAVVVLLPLDIIFFYNRLTKFFNCRKLIIMETELWPGLIYYLKDTEINILNGRLSPKNFPVYKIFKKVIRKILDRVEKIYPKNITNRKRFIKLGVPGNKVEVPLNLKYIFSIPRSGPKESRDPRYFPPSGPVLVCGSTHPKEEKIILEVYKRAIEQFGDLSLIISPRHLNRVSRVENLIEKNNFKNTLWSKKSGKLKPREIVVVDTMGELEKIYSLATLAFVGGSLIPHGGQNIIEPAVYKIPVITGQYFYNFEEIVMDLKETGGIVIVKTELEFYREIVKILKYPKQSLKRGKRLYAELMKRRKENTKKLSRILD